MSTRPFNPLPACPHPIQWDVPGRITELQTMIDDPTTSEPQKKNLQTAINLYRENELPGHFKWIQDGKVVPHKNIDFKRPYWVEVLFFTSILAKRFCAYSYFNPGLWAAVILTGYGSEPGFSAYV